MTLFLSLVTSVKDYVEILHKLVETNSTINLATYYDLGAAITFLILLLKESFLSFISFKWIQDTWSISTLIPDIASSIISEISIFDGLFKTNLEILENPLSYGNQNFLIYCLEKFVIGIFNSLFLCLTISTSSIITLRRFVMQGLEAGSIAALGSIIGTIIWIGSITFGLRFLVIPWISLDILRYILGFVLLIKYMWDSYRYERSNLTDFSKRKIFLLNFLLAFTEQTNLFPFFSHLSLSPDSIGIEIFPIKNSFEFFVIHGSYLLGILLGSLSLLQFFCWFWENGAYNIYLWTLSSIGSVLNPLFKTIGPTSKTPQFSSKFLNFVFLYLTMICTLNSIGYFGLDYMVTNPLGMVHEDRLIEQKILLETSFLNSKASDRNTRRNRGRHGRRERWKRRVRSYRTFDASLYDQGVYDLFPIEDLNYGFDRFWLRRKLRNHRVRFRFFPGPWMRSLKKQFAKPRLESFMGPRVEFFRILFEQAYDPEFHEFTAYSRKKSSLYSLCQNPMLKKDIAINSFLRKFLRKTDNRLKVKQIQNLPISKEKLYSKTDFQTKILEKKSQDFSNTIKNFFKTNKLSTEKKISKSDLIIEYKNFLNSDKKDIHLTPTFLHPLKFYIQKEKSFRKKWKFYGVKNYRSYSVENNAPYFRVMMKRFFYYYKPSLRWERTMRVATMRKARRKGSRVFRKWTGDSTALNYSQSNPWGIQKPTHSYSLVSKKASRYRYQIYKDVLQHWYYNKMNRLLMKFDIDSFIKRQPKNHFLTKNEEILLHVRRFLLLEYSNSLRSYNLMQHYNTMKATIGKTKSFSNHSYNQQFFGTFKKIRHLFSITPSFNQKVLKFDQLLYNEFPISNSLIHEELKHPKSNLQTSLPLEFSNHSQNQVIKKDVFTNQTLWFTLLKKCQTKLYDQKALKNFLQFLEKNESQLSEKTKKLSLEKFQTWFSEPIFTETRKYKSSDLKTNEKLLTTFPSSIKKALKISMNKKPLKSPKFLKRKLPFNTKENLKQKLSKNHFWNYLSINSLLNPFNHFKFFFQNLDRSSSSKLKKSWPQIEKVLSKRKKIRKTFKRLKTVENFQLTKNSILTKLNKLIYFSKDTSNDWQSYLKNLKNVKEFKKRRSRVRRYRFFKGRGPIRKRTRKFSKDRIEFNETIFEPKPMKQSRTLIKKHRYWKKHKKPNLAQTKRKLRKRRRYLKAKIRVLTKKFYLIKFQYLWYKLKDFLPDSQILNSAPLSSNKIESKILNQFISTPNQGNFQQPSSSNLSINSIPFYAGWDENSRKFVITNRLLSRKKAGFLQDSNGFLNSMNAATTLYWQIPFTTYDPDQFFALGMDGFSPINWKNFSFLKTTKPILVQKMNSIDSTKFSVDIDGKIFKNQFSNSRGFSVLDFSLQKDSKTLKTSQKFKRFHQILFNRRVQKSYKRVKKHPRPPVWFPSGPLTSQILPVHYIYVFYKRYGLPRDRYIRRKLRSSKNQSLVSMEKSPFQIYDYTLRKRVKPKRKYHRKSVKLKTENLVQKILRRPFRGYINEKIRFRPSSNRFFKDSIPMEKLKKPLEKKLASDRENLRLRQLRRRVQRQVFRPVWRYKPQAGGFIWPGDYLRLDSIKAPKLGTLEKISGSNSQRKIRKKKRRGIPEWQIQPKKYLFQKHNKKVLKKRLEKSQKKIKNRMI